MELKLIRTRKAQKWCEDHWEECPLLGLVSGDIFRLYENGVAIESKQSYYKVSKDARYNGPFDLVTIDIDN